MAHVQNNPSHYIQTLYNLEPQHHHSLSPLKYELPLFYCNPTINLKQLIFQHTLLSTPLTTT